jgi:hypothetical protein
LSTDASYRFERGVDPNGQIYALKQAAILCKQLAGGKISMQILFWGVVILCMPLGLLLMLIFGFWFVTEVSCQIIYGDIEKVFHIEESIRKMKDAELEAALQEDYGERTDDTEE